MRLKVLTVDDSKAVRIIVKKAFATYDVDILEAANGVEGLAVAGKENPDIVLLDVTMPVMDGVEMLTKMKADPQLKNLPVIMLTAEAGRENVMKIAKIGIRDYIVKPFKEEVLVEKTGRIIDLRPAGDSNKVQKKMTDACEILVVEDKPAIVEQIKVGLKDTPWRIHHVTSAAETIDFCTKTFPDVIVISLSLPDEAAISTFRMLRSNVKTKYIPVFGLAVKTATDEQHQAQQAGFTSIITKPIDFQELQSKIAKAINLDTSQRYFSYVDDFLVIRLPKSISHIIINEVSSYLKQKISAAVDSGYYKVIIDVQEVEHAEMEFIHLIHDTIKVCRDLTLAHALVGSKKLSDECKGFEEAKEWNFVLSIEEAKKMPSRT
ncbi:MAG: histidine kinase [Verrucomicrobia bacterium GWF2_51_19]|nr:MAG: histidine kinase [Verrucomicrobia bacterium GWF2_51_19]HCJ11855.1 response regulator [Opitutae bacterium]